MANAFLKAEQVVRQALGVLEREIVLPTMVWRDAGGNFAGAKGDTISLRVPAYTQARTRVLRGGTPITVDDLGETKVDVTLDTDVYKAVGISDEELTLDIMEFGEQVTRPVVGSVARGVEDAVAAEMSGATYEVTLEVDNTDPYDTLIDARKALNDARVPMSDRGLVVGSSIEARILKSDHLSHADQAGSDTAFREAVIGRIAGFTAISAQGLAPDEGYAFHRSAYVLSMQAPIVPEGATWGESTAFAGLSMRLLRDYDFMNVRDRLLADVFIGTNHVKDAGYFNADGQFQPFTDAIGDPVTITTSAAADDIIDTTTAHGFVAGDRVVFTALTGGTGLTTDREYFVIATSLGAQTFRVSETLGGSGVNFTTDITAGTVRKGGNEYLVRAVKLTDLT
jgi:hypothetical protein